MKYLILLLAPLFLWGDPLISAYAVDCKTGQVLLAIDENKSLIPASTLKVVTTGAALHLLGPQATFKTQLEITGPVKKGVLLGNLVVRGGGDPTLGSSRCALAWDRQIDEWVQALKKLGIHEIKGDVTCDASLWERTLAPASWAWEDLGNYYGAGASALSFNENMYTLTFKPGEKVGAPAILARVFPALSEFIIQNEVITGPVGSGDRACIFGAEYLKTHVVRGTIPDGVEEFSIKGAIPDPAELCRQLLKTSLQRNGIKIGSKHFQTDHKKVIQTTTSPSLSNIVYWTNQKSINLYAEHLLKAMGGGTTEGGLASVKRFWEGQGIEGINMVDGSGLSRKNFITAKQLATILVKMKESPHFQTFYESLPEKMEGVRAKSGCMSFIRCLAGYKGDVAFAILINHGSHSKEMQREIEKILPSMW